MLSSADPDAIVALLLTHIDAKWSGASEDGRPFTKLVLVGHSVGALLVRKLYVVACGETADAPFEPIYKSGLLDGLLPARPWASAVERIILIAGMNRGWRLTHHMGLVSAAWWTLGVGIAHLFALVSRKRPIIMTFRKGATFLTQLRIQWLRMRYRTRLEPAHPGGALTVQLLGSRDDVVGPEDNVDLVSGGDFLYLDVANSGHADVVDMNETAEGRERARVFRLALTGSPASIAKAEILPADERFALPQQHIKQVVFVMHGIRDAGYWTHKVARRVRKRAGSELMTWATETSSYGYFPMLPFLLPWPRRTKVEWFMDQYAEAVARYPRAKFAFIGHSNGTYLLAKALELYPCCRFDRVVFAGSVVRKDFDWGQFIDSSSPQVAAVLNVVSTRDWVVAFFPKVFQFMRLQDLGSAGHDGFAVSTSHPQVHQLIAVRGGHGAGVSEPLWDTLAQFVLEGDYENARLPSLRGRHVLWVKWLGSVPVVVWGVIFAVLILVWKFIIAPTIGALVGQELLQFAEGFALALYIGFIWFVVTRV